MGFILLLFFDDAFSFGRYAFPQRAVIENCDDRLYRAQTITALCSANSSYKSQILPFSYQVPDKFSDSPVFRHYWRSDWMSSNFLEDLNKLVEKMLRNDN